MVFVNGIQKDGYQGKKLSEVIQLDGFEQKKIAVEINGNIISRTMYDDIVVNDGDHIEVVSFVGGG